MTFSEALVELKNGKKAWRKNWNGKDQFIFKVDGNSISGISDSNYSIVGLGLAYHKFCRSLPKMSFKDFLCIKTTSNEIQVGWLASQTDMLSDDWETSE